MGEGGAMEKKLLLVHWSTICMDNRKGVRALELYLTSIRCF